MLCWTCLGNHRPQITSKARKGPSSAISFFNCSSSGIGLLRDLNFQAKVCCGLSRGSPCVFNFRRQPSLHISYILIPVVDENRYARLNDIFQSLTHVVITLEELTAFGKVPFLSFELHSWSVVPQFCREHDADRHRGAFPEDLHVQMS